MKSIPLMICMLFSVPLHAQENDDSNIAGQRADITSRLGRESASAYTVYRDGHHDDRFDLHPAEIFRFTNPVAQESGAKPQEIYGSLAVWTQKGRPEVVFSILNIYSPDEFVVHELTSLSTRRVVAERNGSPDWSPNRAGIEAMSPLDAGAPAATPRGRLVQMRALARQFTASKTDGSDRTTELRLISQPIFRYDSSDPEIADGALFAFADGTDPEVLLMLEARHGDRGDAWHYAAARLNILKLTLHHQQQIVWEAPYLSRTEWSNREEPYVLLRQPE